MNFFSQYIGSSLQPQWKFSVQAILWQLQFSVEGFILGEERDTDTKTGSFFCLNLSNGKSLWQKKTFGETWWIGIEALVGNRAYLHGFKKPDMPEHQGIICVDLSTGNILWKNEQLIFYYANSEYLFAFKELFERRIYFHLALDSGEILKELQSAPELPSVDMSAYTFSQPFSLEHPLYEVLKNILPATFNFKLAEFVEHNNYCIFTSHTPTEAGSFSNTLYIIDNEKQKLCYTATLNKETSYPVPDSFFLFNETLFYIIERKTLVALQL